MRFLKKASTHGRPSGADLKLAIRGLLMLAESGRNLIQVFDTSHPAEKRARRASVRTNRGC